MKTCVLTVMLVQQRWHTSHLQKLSTLSTLSTVPAVSTVSAVSTLEDDHATADAEYRSVNHTL